MSSYPFISLVLFFCAPSPFPNEKKKENQIKSNRFLFEKLGRPSGCRYGKGNWRPCQRKTPAGVVPVDPQLFFLL